MGKEKQERGKNVEKVVKQKNYLRYLEDMDIKNIMIEAYKVEEKIKNDIAKAIKKKDFDLFIMAYSQKEELERKKLEKMKKLLEKCEKKLNKKSKRLAKKDYYKKYSMREEL